MGSKLCCYNNPSDKSPSVPPKASWQRKIQKVFIKVGRPFRNFEYTDGMEGTLTPDATKVLCEDYPISCRKPKSQVFEERFTDEASPEALPPTHEPPMVAAQISDEIAKGFCMATAEIHSEELRNVALEISNNIIDDLIETSAKETSNHDINDEMSQPLAWANENNSKSVEFSEASYLSCSSWRNSNSSSSFEEDCLHESGVYNDVAIIEAQIASMLMKLDEQDSDSESSKTFEEAQDSDDKDEVSPEFSQTQSLVPFGPPQSTIQTIRINRNLLSLFPLPPIEPSAVQDSFSGGFALIGHRLKETDSQSLPVFCLRTKAENELKALPPTPEGDNVKSDIADTNSWPCWRSTSSNSTALLSGKFSP